MDDYRHLALIGLRLGVPNEEPLVLLREDPGDRVLAIWVGSTEALAIARGVEGATFPKPLTHDVMLAALEAGGVRIDSLRIESVEDGVFSANLVLGNGELVVCRPSDGIALWLRARTFPVLVREDVLAEVGLVIGDADEEEVERFKNFLDDVSPADFELPPDAGASSAEE